MRSDLPPWAYALAVKSGALYHRLDWLLRQIGSSLDRPGIYGCGPLKPLPAESWWKVSK